MKYPQDFHLVSPTFPKGEETIDSYALLKSILTEFGVDIRFHLDNALPLIIGNRKSVEEMFKDYLLSAIKEFEDQAITLHLIYKKEWDSSFLIFCVLGTDIPDVKNNFSSLVETITSFKLGICKKICIEQECTER